MKGARTLIRDYRVFAMLIVAAALCVKALVPQGYMVAGGERLTLSVQLCFDGIEKRTVEIAIPTDGKARGDAPGHDGAPDQHCAFSSLAMGALGGADAPLLAMALAFILVLGFAPVRSPPRELFLHLRPPLRGPPLLTA